MEDVCFAQFGKMYRTCSRNKSVDDDCDVDDDTNDDVDGDVEEGTDNCVKKFNHIMTYKNNHTNGKELPQIIVLKIPISMSLML